MTKFGVNYIISMIEKYNEKIKENKCGEYVISKIQPDTEEMKKNVYTEGNKIIKLKNGSEEIMKLDFEEIAKSYQAIRYAKGKVGIAGLGLGITAEEIASKDEVKEVTVYETSREVIELYRENFGENPKIKILNEDAYEAERKHFDFFFTDFYGYEISDRAVSDYEKFNEIHDITEYSFFGMEQFLLSCNYQEILFVYIPENWTAMSKDYYESLNASGLLKYYSQLEEEKTHDILMKFKEIFNSRAEAEI